MKRANLTPEEQLIAAYHHLVVGLEQQDIASMFQVNIGRVNDAVKAARHAFGYTASPTSPTSPAPSPSTASTPSSQ